MILKASQHIGTPFFLTCAKINTMSFSNLKVADRFLRYVQIDTQSDPSSTSFPSTEKQKDLSKILVQELKEMGLTDAAMDEHGYVMATIPATTEKVTPVICFGAHVDTAPDCSGKAVKPILHKNYNGAPIILPDDNTQVITVDKYPYLKNFMGADIITASGLTLLGADDKAGVAIIMEMASYLMQHTSIEHGPIKILFTPDEEVGRGTEKLDLKKLGADFGYTLDGGALGDFEMETFSADGLVLSIEGIIAHPGDAKDKMQNAIKAAAAIVEALPKTSWSPETTSGREGFVHPVQIAGGAEFASIEFIVRDFETGNLKIHATRLLELAKKTLSADKRFDRTSLTMEVKEQYRNMRNILDLHPIVVEKAINAYKKAGLTPHISPIRGGTDGSRLSYLGLPTPNIFTGMQAIHSRHEWIGVPDMEKSVEVLVNVVMTEG